MRIRIKKPQICLPEQKKEIVIAGSARIRGVLDCESEAKQSKSLS